MIKKSNPHSKIFSKINKKLLLNHSPCILGNFQETSKCISQGHLPLHPNYKKFLTLTKSFPKSLIACQNKKRVSLPIGF